MASAIGLQPTGDQRPERTERRRTQDAKRDHEESGQPVLQGQRDQQRTKAAEIGLPLTADVEQPCMEGDRDREAREDQTGRVIERIAQRALVNECAIDQDAQRLDWAFSNDEHDDRRHREGKREIHQRDQQVFDPCGKAGHAAVPSAETPAIIKPIWR